MLDWCHRRSIGWLGRVLCLVVPWVCGIAVVPERCRGEDDFVRRRGELDARFLEQLEALASRCDRLGLGDAARVTRAWSVHRNPDKYYAFLVPDRDAVELGADAAKVREQWYAKFREIRAQRAEALWQLAGNALAAGRGQLAYGLSHEVLREDPDHQLARQALGYRRQNGTWRGPLSPPRLWRGRQRHPQFGWPARQYWLLETEHYRVETDDDRQAAVELAQVLEDLHAVWRQLFLPLWMNSSQLHEAWRTSGVFPTPGRSHRVVLFRDRDQYIKRLARVEPQIDITLGIYRHAERTAYFYGGPENLTDTWRHEATHQLLHEIMNATQDVGSAGNFWIVEGIALYMESLQRVDDYCTLGGFDAPAYSTPAIVHSTKASMCRWINWC